MILTVSWNDLAVRDLVPGFHARLIHTEHLTYAYLTVDEDAELPEHAHPHEQITTVLEGQLALTVAGETHVMGPGEVAPIPGGTPHSARAITACRLLDIFHPVREDYR